MPRVRTLPVLVLVLLLAGGCTLRPRYRSVVPSAEAGGEQRLVLRDAATKAPIAGARVELGEGSRRVQQTTGPDGAFTLPVEQRLFNEDPMVVVALPAGVTAYEFVAAPAAANAQGDAGDRRCGAIFDGFTPALLDMWTKSAPPSRLRAVREKLPELRAAFVEGCRTLPEATLVCGEGGPNTEALEACAVLPAEARLECEAAARAETNPLECRGIARVLDERGAAWARTAFPPPSAEEEAARVGAPWPAEALQALCTEALPPEAPPAQCECLGGVLQAKLSLSQYRAYRAELAAGSAPDARVQAVVVESTSLCASAE